MFFTGHTIDVCQEMPLLSGAIWRLWQSVSSGFRTELSFFDLYQLMRQEIVVSL